MSGTTGGALALTDDIGGGGACVVAIATGECGEPQALAATKAAAIPIFRTTRVYPPTSTCSRRSRGCCHTAKVQATTDDIERASGGLVDATFAEERAVWTKGMKRIFVVASFEHDAVVYRVSLDAQGVLHGLLRTPLAPTEPAVAGTGPADDYVAKRAYGLPVHGRWKVIQGGRDPAGNQHMHSQQQFYALDIDRTGSDGKSHGGDGTKNEDYLAFGESVFAPADGTVVEIVDGVPDNAPPQENPAVATGNHLVIDHGDAEYSLFCHMERGLFTVKVGAHVKAGDLLGKVGNSGNSTEPHLHWQLWNDPRIDGGHGLPIRFRPLLVNGKTADAPAPAQGDLIESAP